MKRIIDFFKLFLCTGALGVIAGCAHAPPVELVNARQAYQHASAGPAAQLAPVELHKAHEALLEAERSFASGPKDPEVRDLAYVAQRQSEIADVMGDLQRNSRTRSQAEQDYQNRQALLVQQTRGELAQTRQQVASLEHDRQQDLTQLSAERQARQQAEQKAALAEQRTRDALEKLAAVKQEDRGLVITLSGSVLFTSDQALLLPDAQNRLNQVAEALLATRERNVVVEGHTDSRGSESHNLDLSQRRADAVRTYLVSRGYPADKIQARGMGKASPIADNATSEGRANNRRVEIVVQPAGVMGGQQ